MLHPVFTRSFLVLFCLLTVGCASQGSRIVNTDPPPVSIDDSYSVLGQSKIKDPGDIYLVLAFSGGGTRAAAMALGVLEALRDQNISSGSLLDEVDLISSVSGGSFTAAYYGLFGKQLFDDFETKFLTKNFQQEVLRRFRAPSHLFSDVSRTEIAVDAYSELLFGDATFADLQGKNGPLILINASDLSRGIPVTFVQEYFDLICSDINQFAVARAVTASSAVPLIFNPVVVENRSGCDRRTQGLFSLSENSTEPQSSARRQSEDLLRSYANKTDQPFVHLVDGGITGNLGLRSLNSFVEMAGGPKSFLQKVDRNRPTSQLVMIVVDAAARTGSEMDLSPNPPGIEKTLTAVTNAQVYRYNADTLRLLKSNLASWATELSTPENRVDDYFIHLSFDDIENKSAQDYVNEIPTSFNLTPAQIDALTEVGAELLRADTAYQELLSRF